MKIIFNGLSTKPLTIRSFSRNTNFSDNVMSSLAYIDFLPDVDTVNNLQAFGVDPIKHILIKDDNNENLYLLRDCHGTIISMSENVANNTATGNMTISFTTASESES